MNRRMPCTCPAQPLHIYSLTVFAVSQHRGRPSRPGLGSLGKGGIQAGAKGKVELFLETGMPRVRERTTDNSLPISFVVQIDKLWAI